MFVIPRAPRFCQIQKGKRSRDIRGEATGEYAGGSNKLEKRRKTHGIALSGVSEIRIADVGIRSAVGGVHFV